MGNQQRVILIKGDHSKWYEQAIFIVRQSVPGNKVPVDFVQEAERIVNGYMGVSNYTPPQKAVLPRNRRRRSSFDLTVNIILLAIVLVLSAFLISSVL